MSQFKFRKSVSAILLGLCLLTAQAWGESASVPYEESTKRYLQWLDHFWTDLETSEVAQLRAASAVQLIQTDDPVARKRGRKLLQDILDTPNPDAVSLWTIASVCWWIDKADFCDTGKASEMLIQADPGNAAASVLRFSQLYMAETKGLVDIQTHQTRLVRAAEAGRFDSYWGRGAVSFYRHTLRYIESNPVPSGMQAMSLDQISEPTAEQFALVMYMSLMHAQSFPYQQIFSFCKAQTMDQNDEAMAACEKLAHTMRSNGNTAITRLIGYGLSREMLRALDPDHPGIASWALRKQVFEIMMHCYVPPWHLNEEIQSETGIATILNWLKNLDELGEWEGNRLSSRQEYEIAPEHFPFDPKKCDRLQALDNENIITLLDGKTPDEAWQRMKADD